jgi:hypothetical protein
VLAYYLGVPLDLFQRIEVDPATINTLLISDEGAKVAGLNR